MRTQLLIILLACALCLCAGASQDASLILRITAPDGSISEVSPQGEESSPAELENEALRSLLGQEETQEEEEPPEEPVARPAARERVQPEQPRETTEERRRPEPVERTESAPRRERERGRPSRGYSEDTAVPEVPVTLGDDEGYDSDSEDEEDLEAPQAAPAAPLSDYRTPFSTGADTDLDQPEEQPLQPAEETPVEDAQAKKGSPASAVIIGLIALAVLLVGLAAVVGIMAAQRAPREAAPVAAAANTGWAYLTAPEAPDIPVSTDSFTMGSDRDCDLRLADPKASPHHARIDETEDGWVLVDLGSINGTYLNGERIASPVTLRPGDEIQMGDIVVNFEVYQ